MLKRNTESPRPSSLERHLLEKSHHSFVDSHLKTLKVSSRLLSQALDAFRDDHKILERLYYKGKNQHRLSLFWRRVLETRRFCQRLNEIHIDQIVDLLRKSFFSDGVPAFERKPTKGSWTHFPDRPFVVRVVQKLNMCFALVTRMEERLLEAYRTFTLAMQSGAFLQLLLTLVAVVSRIRMVCKVLQSTLQSILGITRHLLDLLLPPSILQEHPVLSSSSVEVGEGIKVDVDLANESSSSSKLLESKTDTNGTNFELNAPARTIIKHDIPSSATLERKDGGRNLKKRPKKAKDEIDDIFGF